MQVTEARLFLEGEWRTGASTSPLLDKFTNEPLAEVHEADRSLVDLALADLADAHEHIALTPYERYESLARASSLLHERADAFVQSVIDDTGFTVGDARREVERAVQTLLLSAEEAKRIHGEVVPVDSAPGGSDRVAFTVRHPLGVVCAITPFNSPLNTVAHKVGPALAAGNAIVLKPSSYTPLTAMRLVELLLDAGVPARLLALVQGGGSTVGEWLLESPIPAFYAFTGSTPVGTHIRRSVGLRRTQLELGSLSSTIICDDASLERSVRLCAGASFRKAGQVCTSVQRLYVHVAVIDEFGRALSDEIAQRGVGDPRQPETFVGPVISAKEADRVDSWIDDAVDKGASVVGRRDRSGPVISPTILKDVDPAMTVFSQEVFGPVVSLVPFDDLDAAIADINDTPFGLAAGVFTRDLGRALDAAKRLRMGSVHVNETSSSRLDLMPYGGVKDSGTGVEGPKYAIEEMTEQRLITMGRP